jgi:uncharacterized protein YdhG (YjbR/CyaY superfamily)
MTETFTKEEKAAMRAAAAERRKKFGPEEHAKEVQEKIKAMAPADRKLAQAVHKIVMDVAPELQPKTFYGMQAYFKNDKALVFFQDSGKFKTRYCTLGFQDTANLDSGDIWATSYAIMAITPEVEKKIRQLVKKAVS